MTISKRNARLIRAGIEAARLPHRLRARWMLVDAPHDALTWKAFNREELNVARFRVVVTGPAAPIDVSRYMRGLGA